MKRLMACFLCLAMLSSVKALAALPSNTTDNKRIQVTVRDFKQDGKLFQDNISPSESLVRPALGANRKPDFSDPSNPTQPFPGWKDWTNSEDITVYDLNALFNAATGVNMTDTMNLSLVKGEDGFYQLDKSDRTLFDEIGMFFPIDNQLWGNEENAHNSHFTIELNARFVYTGSERFTFEGDGVAWVFIDGQLVMVSGGDQPSGNTSFELHPLLIDGKLELTPGQSYNFDMFYIANDPSQSGFNLSTTMSLFNLEYGKTADWAVNYLDKAVMMNIITNRLKGSDMTQAITREEFAETAVRFYEMVTGHAAQPADKTFLDCSNPEVLKAYGLKITSGVGDGSKFAPDSPLTRQQMAAMIVNTLRACYPIILIETIGQDDFKDQKQFAAYAVESAKFLAKYSISVGDGKGSFLPTANCTRQEAISFLVRAYDNRSEFISFREVETTVIDGVKIDKTDYPFESDDAVLGEWITVDLIDNPMSFDPEKKQAKRLYYYSIIFYKDGICDKTTYYDGDYNPIDYLRLVPRNTWTKGLVTFEFDDQNVHQTSRYYIAKVKNKEYLFLEYKNGDYTYRNAIPSYYVFTRE